MINHVKQDISKIPENAPYAQVIVLPAIKVEMMDAQHAKKDSIPKEQVALLLALLEHIWFQEPVQIVPLDVPNALMLLNAQNARISY